MVAALGTYAVTSKQVAEANRRIDSDRESLISRLDNEISDANTRINDLVAKQEQQRIFNNDLFVKVTGANGQTDLLKRQLKALSDKLKSLEEENNEDDDDDDDEDDDGDDDELNSRL